MEPSPSLDIMDLTRAAAVELGLLDDSTNPLPAAQLPIMNLNSFSFLPSGDINWDTVSSSKIHSDAILDLDLDLNLDQSPAMSLCTPAAGTPVTFDALGLDELGASPSLCWQSSPLDDSFQASQLSQDTFDYDFNIVDVQQFWPSETDFQLYPEDKPPTITNLEQLLMADPDIPIKDSPADHVLDGFSPIDSVGPSPTLLDYPDLFGDVATTTLSTGYRPPKRQRRRRRTCEDEARVFPEDANDDSEARPRYKCAVCDKTFTRPFNLRSHRAIHAGVKPFTCPHTNPEGEVCGWSFARRHDLERHTQSRHSAKKQFKCQTCGTECARNDAYRRHLQRHPACASAAELMKEDMGLDQEMSQGDE